MIKKYAFGLAALLTWVGLYAWHEVLARHGVPASGVQISYGIGYGFFEFLLIAALARGLPGMQVPVWRLLALITGAALAWVEVRSHPFPAGAVSSYWAVALIGMSLVSLSARFLTSGLRNRWFGRPPDPS